MQVSLLTALHSSRNSEMTMKEIEKPSSLSRPTGAGIFVSRMEEKGIVEACADASDRRVKIVHITEDGEAVSGAQLCVESAEERLVSGFSNDEVRTLLTFLEHMRGNLK